MPTEIIGSGIACFSASLTHTAYGERFASVFNLDLLQDLESLLDVGLFETVAGFLQPVIRLIAQNQIRGNTGSPRPSDPVFHSGVRCRYDFSCAPAERSASAMTVGEKMLIYQLLTKA